MISFRFLACLAALSAAATGAEPTAEVQMQAQCMSLFKNGYALVQLAGVLPQGTEAHVRNLPVPVFGTLDWQTPQGTEIESLTGSCLAQNESADCTNFSDLARANVGREVSLTMSNGRTCSGVIISPCPHEPEPQGAFIEQKQASAFDIPSDIIVLRTSRGDVISLPNRAVLRMDFASDSPRVPSPQPQQAELRLRLSHEAPGQQLTMKCLAWGISWLPEYRLELADNGTAQIEGRVVVMNELIDLEHARLELVTGFPALGDSLVSSPIVRLTNLELYLHAINTGIDWLNNFPARNTHDSYRARALAEVDGAYAEPMPQSAPAQETGRQTEDLFYYSIPDVTCKRGETFQRDLFSASIPCTHLYTCYVPDQRGLESQARAGSTSIADIWHCLRLTNTGDIPWSTGVVACYKGEQLISRGMLGFIAPGRFGLLRLSKVTGASISCREQQLSKGSSKSRSSKFFSSSEEEELPEVNQGTLELTNHTDQEMEFELVKAIIGTPTDASDNARIDVSPPVYTGNSFSTITWKFHLAPGESKSCTYTYEIFTSQL